VAGGARDVVVVVVKVVVVIIFASSSSALFYSPKGDSLYTQRVSLLLLLLPTQGPLGPVVVVKVL